MSNKATGLKGLVGFALHIGWPQGMLFYCRHRQPFRSPWKHFTAATEWDSGALAAQQVTILINQVAYSPFYSPNLVGISSHCRLRGKSRRVVVPLRQHGRRMSKKPIRPAQLLELLTVCF
jgi:hypothetical protein